MRRSDRPAGGEALVAMAYRSRAVEPMSDDFLHRLEQAADARNRREGVTGVMVYDDGQFFQWLEGPAQGLGRIWSSIQSDTRHTDIRVSTRGACSGRLFTEHGMKLLRREDPLWATSALLAAKLPVVVDQVVIPLLATRRAKEAGQVTPVSQVEQLAHLLIATDETAAWALARELSGRAGPFEASRGAVVEPAARSLGDLWYRDDCSSVELDLGLFRLEAIVHELAGRAVAPALSNRAVLIAPQPGEPHLLGAALDAEVLCHAGWATRAEFPGTDEALQALVADEWFDVVDLSLSTALRREGSLARLARTITGTRRASCNPALVVVVGGRVFAERHEVCAGVGADVNASVGVTLAATIEGVLCRPRSTQPRRERPSSGRTPRSRAIRS